jgi:hypothetical protein
MIRDRVRTEIGLMTGRIKKSFRNGRAGISGMRNSVSKKTRRAARQTDYYVHDHAWKLIGVAAGLAFAAGFFISARNQEAIAASIDGDDSPQLEKKARKLNSWEFVHSALPMALFLWKALQGSRCARRRTI